ncbi:MAG: V-type ATPase subunit [Candidatus Scalinduaceae bacterium]
MNTDKDILVDVHDWCFVSGKINVLESSLFTHEFYERLLDIKTVDDVFKYIANSKLRGYFRDEESIYDFEKSIDAYFFDNINEIRQSSPTTIICDMFLLRYKFLDLKNYLKNKLIGIPHELITFYILKDSDLECLWNEKEEVINTIYKAYPYFPALLSDRSEALLNGVNNLKKVLREDKEFTKNDTSWTIDLIMDNAHLCYLAKISEQIPIQYIKEYLKKFIFISVMKSMLRVLFAGCNMELFKKYFLRDFLHRTCFLNLSVLPINEWKEILTKELPAKIVKCIISNKAEEEINNVNLTRCEKLLDNYLLDIIKPLKHIAFGAERVFGYLCGLDVEVYNSKLAMGGKINKIETQLLKDRLRNCYV